MNALLKARKRGVQITILVPQKARSRPRSRSKIPILPKVNTSWL